MNRIFNFFAEFIPIQNFEKMKLHFLFFIAADASEIAGSAVDESWKNSEAFELPEDLSLRTERADQVLQGQCILYAAYSMRQI